jgi:hypothetical protein
LQTACAFGTQAIGDDPAIDTGKDVMPLFTAVCVQDRHVSSVLYQFQINALSALARLFAPQRTTIYAFVASILAALISSLI